MRTTFVVGRLTTKSSEMVVVKDQGERSPFPGPWSLRAIVRRAPARREGNSPAVMIH